MNAVEMLDERAAQGGLNSVIVTKVGGGWQVSVKSAITDSYAVRNGPTPGEALRLALELLPVAEAYDAKYGLARNAPPDIFEPATNKLLIGGIEPEDNCACGGGEASGHDTLCPERIGPHPAGVFD